ncbi:hypothetical protein Tco_1157091 [Tanacetum coccineum]
MSTYLKNMDGYKHNQLKNKSFDDIQKLFGKAMKRVNIFVDMDTELMEVSKVRAEAEISQESSSKRTGTELEQESNKKQKVDEDKETTELQRLIEVVPGKEEVAIDAIPLATKPLSIGRFGNPKKIEKRYPLTAATITDMLNKKLQCDHFSEMGRIVRIKRLHDDLEVIAAKLRNSRSIQVGSTRLMRSDELYKFCDGTLTSVKNVLHDIANNLRMEYLPKRRWSNLDRKRSLIMIKAIDQQLFERRLMRNLEKFVGGREYRVDFRLLERTI